MIRTRILFTFLLFPVAGNLFSQDSDTLRKGIHQEESEFYSSFFAGKEPIDSKGIAYPSDLNAELYNSKGLKARVLGWHPYWAEVSAYQNYDYEALSHIAYFSYEVDTATGGYTSIHSWYSTGLISYAHDRGTKILMTVTNFGSAKNTKLLSDTAKQITLLNTLIPLLKGRNADGVNFDLETVSVSQRDNLVKFMRRAASMIKAEIPGAEISMATPAVDWSGSWDLQKLSDICDYLIIMGYNYYWSSSSTAGPVAPLAGETYSVSKSITTYLNAGVPPEKLMLGVPWYGYDWPVSSAVKKAATTGTGSSRTYSVSQAMAAQYSHTFDIATSTPWLSYKTGTLNRQMWYEDNKSLLMKYDYTASKELAGIGIWAVSYEGTYSEVWSAIKEVFYDAEPESTDITLISPNPVRGTSEISFSLLEKESVSLKIFDSGGRERLILVDEERDPGFYKENFSSEGLTAGIYFCTMKTRTKTIIRKIVIVR